MRNVLKWVGIVLGALIGLIVLAVIVLYAMGSQRLSRRYDVAAENIAIPTDAASIERGKHVQLVAARLGVEPRGIGKIQHRIAAASQRHALMVRGQ